MKYLVLTVSIAVYLSLLIILIINLKKKNQLIKYAFIAYNVLMIVVINMYDLRLIDFILYNILRYIYYPTYNTYLLTIVITFFLFLYNVANSHLENYYRIINYVFSIILIISFISFFMLNVDVSIAKELYTGLSLVLLRITSCTFLLWLIVLLVIKYYHISFGRGKYEK